MPKNETVVYSNGGPVEFLATPLAPFGTPIDPLGEPSHSAHHASLHNAITEIDTALTSGAGWNDTTAAVASGAGLAATGSVLSADVDGSTVVLTSTDPTGVLAVGVIGMSQVADLDTSFDTKADKTTQVVAGPGLLGGGALSGDVTLSLDSELTTDTFVRRLGDTMQGTLSMGGYPLVSLPDTGILEPTDAAPVWYVDQTMIGVNPHEAVAIATADVDGIIDVSVCPPTLDGYDMTLLPVGTGRVLVKNQNGTADRAVAGAGVQNGIYIFQGVGVPLTRAADATIENDLSNGSTVFVTNGATGNGTVWICQMLPGQEPWTPDVDDTFWHLYSDSLNLVPGMGLTLAGNLLDVVTGQGLASSETLVYVPPSGIVTEMLSDSSVVESKLAASSVATEAIQDGAVTGSKLDASLDALNDVDTITVQPAVGDVLARQSTGQWSPAPPGPPTTRTVQAGSGLVGGGTLASDIALAVGAGAGVVVDDDTVGLDVAYADGRYLNTAGDTAAGPINLPYPTTPGARSNEATNQRYVDETITVASYIPDAPPSRDGQLWVVVTAV